MTRMDETAGQPVASYEWTVAAEEQLVGGMVGLGCPRWPTACSALDYNRLSCCAKNFFCCRQRSLVQAEHRINICLLQALPLSR